MAGNRGQEEHDMRELDPKPQPDVPRLGILSRTIFSTPYVKFILPASIRQKNLNDVVFVGEDSIHLKEARANGSLRHIASKRDFDGRILAARIYRGPRKHEVKAEHGTPIQRKEVHAQRRSTASETADILPPEVIVLTLSSKTLVFAWAYQSPVGTVGFRCKTVRLPAGISPIDRTGTFLAIDPKCRAVAVAASEGHFILYKTKNMDAWREDIRAGHDSTPIEDERIIPIQGRIMHMEFLSSGATQDDSHVVLLFILAYGGKTKFTCYDWDSKHDLNTATARAERVGIVTEDHNPSLLIPLKCNTDFLMIFDRHVSWNTNALSGILHRSSTPFQNEDLTFLRSGDGKCHPRWVQWERVARNEDFPKEAFYIAREDGNVLYMEIGPSNVIDISEGGQVQHSVDTAFASLDVDSGTLNRLQPDILVAAGTTSDGSLLKVGSWVGEGHNLSYLNNNTFAPVESIPNWTPTSDITFSSLAGFSSPYERERDGIFVATGRCPHGSVTELRLGFNALIDAYAGGFPGCTRLSIVDHGSEECLVDGRQITQHYAVLLVTIPPESIVMRIHLVNGQWNLEQISESVLDGVLHEETIAASLFSERIAVQITPDEARILERPALGRVDSYLFSNPLLAAAMNPKTSYIAVAFRDGMQPVLQTIKVVESGRFLASYRQELSCDPTCIENTSINDTPIILVATIDSTLQIFTIMDAGIILVRTLNLGPPGMTHVCESVVLIGLGDQRTMLCGMRNGTVVSFALSLSDSGIDVTSMSLTRMGNTAVRITRSTTNPSMAFSSCGADFCRIYQRPNSVEINSIWFTGIETESYQHAPITALDQVPPTNQDDEGLAGVIFAASDSRLLIAQLGQGNGSIYEEPQPVPRKMLIRSTPTKLLYTSILQRIIVTTNEPSQARPPPFNGYRTIRSRIELIKLRDDDDVNIKKEGTDEAYDSLSEAKYELNHYERVNCVLEWVIDDEKGRPHHFVYAGTAVTNHSTGQETGRRLFLQVVDSTIRMKKEKLFDKPVRCMVLFDDKHLITIAGKIMILDEYENARWIKRGTIELPSDGVHLSVSRPFAYVSTARHSHVCYEVKDFNTDGNPFERVFTDSRSRTSVYHAVIPLELAHLGLEQTSPISPSSSSRMDIDSGERQQNKPTTIVVLSDKGCNVTGLLHPPQRMNKSDTHTLFEASLPRTVTRLHQANIRPPWRRPYSGAPAGILCDDLVGSCTDGTIYSFSVLSDSAFILLKLIQNLVLVKECRKFSSQHSTVRQSSGALLNVLMNGNSGDQSSDQSIIKLREIDPEVGKPNPRFRHIDADAILRFFDEDLMTRPFEDAESLFGLLTVNVEHEVGRRFAELAHDLGILSDPPKDERDLVKTVGSWMKDVMMELL